MNLYRVGGWDIASELKWAWRAVLARGWRAGLAAALLAIAIAANTIVFSAADALVFNRVPYAELDRLAWFGSASPAALHEWRQQSDLFDGVHGYTTRPVFAIGQDQPAVIDVVDVTPGLLDMLGAFPRWGRRLTDADAREAGVEIAVISERLARARFGAPAAAVGQRLETTGAPILIAGVIPDWFRFPAGSYDMWRAADAQSGRYRFMRVVARLAAGRSVEAAAPVVKARGAEILARTSTNPARPGTPPGLQPMRQSRIDDEPQRLLFIIAGAALCLLLTACANVAALELADAVNRIRSFGIRVALGATRTSLIRGALLEGLLLLIPAGLAAVALAFAGTAALAAQIPERVFDSMNPIDVDGRSIAYTLAIALLTWIGVTLPLALFSSRRNVVEAVRAEGRAVAASRLGGRLRAVLTSAEIAAAVLLLAGGLLYARTYQSLLGIDKGFDTTNLAALTLTLPTQSYPTAQATRLLEDRVIASLSSRADVTDVSAGMFPPSQGEVHQASALEVDGRPAGRDNLTVGITRVDDAAFRTLRIPLRAGRLLTPDAGPDEAVIAESFARAFWPAGNAVGGQFRIMPGFPVTTVVGIAGHVRYDADSRTGPSDRQYRVYVRRQPPREEPAANAPRNINDLPLYGSLQFAARLEPEANLSAILTDIRAIDSRFRLRLQWMDDIYASRFDDTLFATRIVTGFASLAFVLAIAGVYGVMAFLVAGRTREIGIRMALGADPRDISRLVLRSSLTMVVVGAGLGVAAALLASRWAGAQFFGVAPTSPGIYLLVTAVVVATSLLATWRPARAAARIDPAITLKNN